MALTEVERMFGPSVIAEAEAFQVRGQGLRGPSDALIEHPRTLTDESEAGPGGLYGFSGETAQRMGRRYLIWDPTHGWIPNTEALIDER